jgi:hypothetical protein
MVFIIDPNLLSMNPNRFDSLLGKKIYYIPTRKSGWYVPMLEIIPQLDPIALPAPVWFQKILLIPTWIIHILIVQFLVGAIVTTGILKVRRSALSAAANTYLLKPFPIVFALLVNFGIPPLLFVQTLYGQFVYSSTILMGFWWIIIIPIVITTYLVSYRIRTIADRERGYRMGWAAVFLIGLFYTGFILTNIMTLMLEPQSWQTMYQNSSAGLSVQKHSMELMLRFLYFLVGGGSAVGSVLIASGRYWKNIEESHRLKQMGSILYIIFLAIGLVLGFGYLQLIPSEVQAILASDGWYLGSCWLYVVFVLGGIGLGILGFRMKNIQSPILYLPAGIYALVVLIMAVIRDRVRDAFLSHAGFSFNQVTVQSDVSVIILFLLLFVAALIAIFFMHKWFIQDKNA